MPTLERIRKLRWARQLIVKGWSQREPAVNVDGARCWTFSDQAVAYSLTGALDRAFGVNAEMAWAYDFVKGHLPPAYHGKPLFHFNDAEGRTQGDIIQVLTNAIRTAEHAHLLAEGPNV